MKKRREDDVLFICVIVSRLFLMQSFTQQSCISLLHILCNLLSIFLETSGIIVKFIVREVVLSPVAGTGLALTYLHHSSRSSRRLGFMHAPVISASVFISADWSLWELMLVLQTDGH